MGIQMDLFAIPESLEFKEKLEAEAGRREKVRVEKIYPLLNEANRKIKEACTIAQTEGVGFFFCGEGMPRARPYAPPSAIKLLSKFEKECAAVQSGAVYDPDLSDLLWSVFEQEYLVRENDDEGWEYWSSSSLTC